MIIRFSYLLLLLNPILSFGTTIEINTLSGTKPFKHFWKSTGFCPPEPRNKTSDFLLSKDERFNLVLIGALPNRGIRQVRVHWLVNLIRRETSAIGKELYNYTDLDEFIEELHKQGLYPRFELMGLPLNVPKNVSSNFWFDLTEEIASRYLKRYGSLILRNWRFETWNEPDLNTYNLLNYNLTDYLLYVSSSSNGLNSALKNVTERPKFGGPAGLFKDPSKHPLCWGLLEECEKLNSECPLDYISFHRKGGGMAAEVVDESVELVDEIRKKFKGLKDLPVTNDEADILVNWSRNESWRGDTRYACMMTAVVINFYKKIVLERNLKIELLSNDNGFLNYNPHFFTQRTLLARFQMNNTNPPHVQFIKKPIYTATGLLSLSGNEYLKHVKITPENPLLTVLATRSRLPHTYTFIIVYSNDTATNLKTTGNIKLQAGYFRGRWSYAIYLLDNIDTNPFLVWVRQGVPSFPSKEIRKSMRDAEGPLRLVGPTELDRNQLQISLDLFLPSLVVVLVCSKRGPPPGLVKGLRVYDVTQGEVLLVWKDREVRKRCLKTYEVEFRGMNESTFTKINTMDIIFPSYHYVSTGSVKGKYRVRAVDFWSRNGNWSAVITHL